MCEYCKGKGKIEMDNNGPIVDCPVCESSALTGLLNADALQAIVNAVCLHTPKGVEIRLCINSETAWVEYYRSKCPEPLPDTADKTLLEQLNDALCVANGWSI